MADPHTAKMASGQVYAFPTQFSAVAFALGNSLTQKVTVLDEEGGKVAVFYPHKPAKPEHQIPNGPRMQHEAEKARATRLADTGNYKKPKPKTLKRKKPLKKRAAK